MSNLLFIEWNPQYELGIPIIDEQHRGLVSAINSFYYFIKEGSGVEAVKPTIITIVQYIEIHFRTEEPLMKKSGYPGFDDHIQMHRKLTDKTRRIAMEATESGDAMVALEFLKDWWENHIKTIDKQYAPYVKALLGLW